MSQEYDVQKSGSKYRKNRSGTNMSRDALDVNDMDQGAAFFFFMCGNKCSAAGSKTLV